MSSGHRAAVLASLNILLGIAEARWPDTPSGKTYEIDFALDAIVDAWHGAQWDIASAVVALKVERNATVKAMALPAELLRSIFLFLQEDWKTVLAASQVCTRWRDLIVHDAELWTHIDMNTTPQPVVRLFSERSRGRSLSIKLLMNLLAQAKLPVDWRDLFCYCEASRIKRFQLVVPRTLYAMSLSPADLNSVWVTENAMSLLEELSITAEYPTALRSEDYILKNFLSGGAPRLRSLTLDGVWLSWGSGAYRGLTKLHIRLKGLRALRPDSDRSILRVFRDSPDLEDIFLSIPYAIQNIYSRINDTSLIELPHAKRVELELVPEDLTNLLSSISLPDSLPFLKLRCKCFTPGTIAECLPSDSRCLPDFNELTAITVDLRANEVRLMPGLDRAPQSEPQAFIIEVAQMPHTSTSAFMSVIAKLRALRDQPFFAVYTCGSFSLSTDEEFLTEVLGSVPPVHTLGLSGFPPQTLGVLEAALADMKLDQLEFYQMRLEADALLQLTTTRHAQIGLLAMLQCTLLAPSATDASLVLDSVTGLLHGEIWYKDMSFHGVDDERPKEVLVTKSVAQQP